MGNAALFADLTRERIRRLAPEAVVVVPVGATEQHGPHLPVGTDTFAVGHIAWAAALAAAERATVVVTPTLPFGSSHHHLPFGGTISLSTETYYRAVREITESLIGTGFRRLLLLNGHGGNRDIISLVARDLSLIHPVRISAASYWEIARQAVAETAWSRTGDVPGHAGAFESSVVLALRPELATEPLPHRDEPDVARLRQQPGLIRIEDRANWSAIDGYTDSPDRASGDEGRAYLDLIVAAVADAYVELAVGRSPSPVAKLGNESPS
ncbi:MAG: creatininase family protein [Chloroflexota bacterium]|nr:creatininase family protein [Chloroflexota bacterium]